jgi:3-mercaptopyruvate sulfurtransferase SseA
VVTLNKNGFQNAAALLGGFQLWQKEGKPVERKPVERKPVEQKPLAQKPEQKKQNR